MHEIEDKDLRQILLSNEYVVVYFYATWCGPCKAVAAALEKAPDTIPDVTFVKLDVTANKQYLEQMSVRSIPTVILLSGNDWLAYFCGRAADPRHLENQIKEKVEAHKVASDGE